MVGLRKLIAGTALAGALLACVAPASAGETGEVHEVAATGNPVLGGLAFSPQTIRVAVGDTVRWTNTDLAVPHTATENHGLWRLTGTYGDPLGVFPSGFGPGESRERVFEAGRHVYYCEVHGNVQRGVIKVPVTLALGTAANGRLRVNVTWAPAPPEDGLVFDLQGKRSGERWQLFRDGTTKPAAHFKAGRPGTIWRFRARLRKETDAAKSTDWSPISKIEVAAQAAGA